MMMYIKGMGNISPQKTWDEGTLLHQPVAYSENKLQCIEPDYAQYIDAKQIRRMSRIIKMGVASAFMALKEANVAVPDGIITATGYGCLEDTGIFLNKMIENKEEALNPTPFIQSTHNTIGSQIALMLQCQAYNQTYTHGAFSFESALLDSMLQLTDNPGKNFLVGGVDEITPASHQIQQRFRIFRKKVENSLALFAEQVQGTINGEVAAFFVLSGNRGSDAIAAINGVTTFYKPTSEMLKDGIQQFVSAASLSMADIDLVLAGKCGDSKSDAMIDKLIAGLFSSSNIGVYKHLCGECPVAAAFACWLGARMLNTQQIPEIVGHHTKDKPLKNILVVNQYFGTHYTLILLQAC